MFEFVIGLILGLLIGAVALWVFSRRVARQGHIQDRSEADRIVREAEGQAESVRLEAEEIRKKAEAMRQQAEATRQQADATRQQAETLHRQAELDAQEVRLKAKEELEKEAKSERAEIQRLTDRAEKREEAVERKAEVVAAREDEATRKEKDLAKRAKGVEEKEASVDQIVAAAKKELERVAGMTPEEARKQLVDQFLDEARHAAAVEAKRIEDEAKEEAEKRAKRIVGIATQRFASEYIQERAVTAVELPSDDMKGRIIGREGRNIRALEAACGVDLVIDDTPETVVISGFDPVRREVARIALERLIADGRIHPTRIEDLVTKAREEVERSIRETGEQAILELGLSRIHAELVRLLGSLRYRYSYAQNVLRHSVETGFIAGLLAAELKMNVKQARRAGLLHDIGKAVSHEQEGSHAVVGAQIARKYGEAQIIVNAIASHHEDEPQETVLAHLVAAADALSGARPGARREMLETYVKRLEALEEICRSFSGVESSYAVQAGREVRVMVESEKISDADARQLSREIAKKIEGELTYPGQIRVTVIRETRAVEYAK
jgi:ribonuclease Y